MSETTWFRGDIARGIDEPQKIDKNTNVIYGFSVMTLGEAKGHGVFIDDTTFEQCVDFGNKAKMGIKSRYGHPTMSSEALGTHLGRVKNFRRDGDRVRADLNLDPSCFNTPKGDLGSYIMQLAESDPAAFGASIVFKRKYVVKRKDEDGKEVEEEIGYDEGCVEPKKGEKVFARIIKLLAVDVVDEAAANDGLFGVSDSVLPAIEMSNFLEKFLAEPDAVNRVISFLTKYQDMNNYEADEPGESGNSEPDVDVYGVEGENYEAFPLKSEHACRKVDPAECKDGTFRRVRRRSKSAKKSYDVLMAKLKTNNKMVEQSFRYPTIEWTEEEAEKHCKSHKGLLFEPARKEENNKVADNTDNKSDTFGEGSNETVNKEVKGMSEEVKTDRTEELEALKAEMADKDKALAEKEESIARYVEKMDVIEKEKRELGVKSWIESKKVEGKVLPKFEEKLTAIMLSANDETLTSLKELVDEFPEMVDYSEQAEGGSDIDVPGANSDEKVFKLAEEIQAKEGGLFSNALAKASEQLA
jgi:hypothetical protein